MPESELWIGMVLLKPLTPKALKGAAGAFANMITWASSPEQFRKKADTLAAEMDLYVVETEDVEPLAAWRHSYELTEEVEEMVEEAQNDAEAIVFGPFYQYPHEDA